MISLKHLAVIIIFLFLFGSCRFVYPDLMFQTPKDYEFNKVDSITSYEYRLKPGDLFTLQVLSNNGYALVDVVGFNGSYLPMDYEIHKTGYASLPLLDSLYVIGLTSQQLEDTLSVKYSYYFVNPFIRVGVKDKRVYYFSGRGNAGFISLTKDNTTLAEVLAAAGGLSNGKAKNVKVIRGVGKDAQIFLFNLSTFDHYKQFEFIVRSNDVIYVQPIKGAREFFTTVGPAISLVTSILFLVTLLQRNILN